MTDLTTEDLLHSLVEECSEVIQAACKCLRFGYTRDEPGYGKNDVVLAQEIGDLIGIIRALPLDATEVAARAEKKLSRVKKWKQYAMDNPVAGA